MGLRYNTYLSGTKIYGCAHCKAHLADHDDILSRVSPDHLPGPNFTLLSALSPLLHALYLIPKDNNHAVEVCI